MAFEKMKQIKEMPTKELLEDYLNCEDGVKVIFNIETGKFERNINANDYLPNRK